MRFFFDTYDGSRVVTDDEGRDLLNVAAAQREAIEDAKELISIGIFRSGNLQLGEVRVRHWAQSSPIFAICFKDVIEGLRG